MNHRFQGGAPYGYNFPPGNSSNNNNFQTYNSSGNMGSENIQRAKPIDDYEIKQYVAMSENAKRDFIFNKLSNPYPEMNRWSDLILLIVEYSYKSAYSITSFSLEVMKNMNPEIYRAVLVQSIGLIIKRADRLDALALILRSIFSDKIISIETKQAILKHGPLIDEKFIAIEKKGNLDEYFCTQIVQNYLEMKYAGISMEDGLEFDAIGDSKERIKCLYLGLIKPFGGYLKALDSLHEPFVKWLVLLDSTNDRAEQVMVLEICEKISLSCKSSSSFMNFFSDDFDTKKICKVFKNMFMCLKIDNSGDSLLQTHMNMFLIIESLPEEIVRKMASERFSDLYQDFQNPQDATMIFKNLFLVAVTSKLLLFFEIFSRMLLAKNQYSLLALFYREIVLKILINKLRGQELFQRVLEVIKFYMIGFSSFVYPSPYHFHTILSHIEIKFTKKYIKSQMNDIIFVCQATVLNAKLDKNPSYGEAISYMKTLRTTYNLELISTEMFKSMDSMVWRLNDKEKSLVEQAKEILRRGSSIFTKSSKYKGLVNMGNTCYMNSFIQCLFMNLEFKNFIQSLDPIKLQSRSVFMKFSETLLSEFVKLFAELASGSGFECKPLALKEKLPEPFQTSTSQQDSSEFGKIFLDAVQRELSTYSDYKAAFSNFFHGKLENRIGCQDCKTVYKSYENYSDLNIMFDMNKKNHNIIEMIRGSFNREELKDSNKFFCENCSKYSSLSYKDVSIRTIPETLMITAQRFCFNHLSGERTKIDKKIDVSQVFHIADIISDDSKIDRLNPKGYYELCAYIVHSGFTPDSGHYFTFAKDLEDPKQQWYLFNDVNVKCLGNKCGFEELGHWQTPYIFFYKNKSKTKISLEEISLE